MALIISTRIGAKLLTKHNVTQEDIDECFATREKGFLEDPREEHRTDPPTLWFVSETFLGRKLKVIFVKSDGDIFIKSAFDPNREEIRIYNKFAK